MRINVEIIKVYGGYRIVDEEENLDIFKEAPCEEIESHMINREVIRVEAELDILQGTLHLLDLVDKDNALH